MVSPRERAFGASKRSGHRTMLVDPAWFTFDNGFFARHALHEDTYFEPEPQDSALGLALDSLLDSLPDEERVCVELRVFGQHSYSQIARHMGWSIGEPSYPNKKRAWRAVRKGLSMLRKRIGDRQWLESLAPRPEVLKEEDDV